MKMWMMAPMAALMLCALALPTVAQDKKDERTFSLKTKDVKDQAITEKSKEYSEKVADIAGGMAQDKGWENEKTTKVTEILEVDENGKRTKARVKWTAYEGTEKSQKPGQTEPSAETKKESDLLDASILYTWNKETKKWDAKLEKGDAEKDDVKKQLAKANPFLNPFVPERDVKLGEEWDADEAQLKELFTTAEVEVSEAKAKCKATETGKEDGVEYVQVNFEITLKGKLLNDEIGSPEMEAKITGWYAWDIGNGRIAGMERKNEMGFDTVIATDDGDIPVKFTGTGSEEILITYAAIEKVKEGK